MKMKDHLVTFKEKENPIFQNSVPGMMLVACVLASISGIILMAWSSHYMIMAVYISIIICVCITTPLFIMGKISIGTACLAPMLILCFVNTPLSWLTFYGLLGPMPYLSILYITIITLTYYGRTQTILLSLYGLMLLGLTIHWLMTWTGTRDMEQIINLVIAYIVTIIFNSFFIEKVKRKNTELNQQFMELSLKDDLTGLLNRRAFEQISSRLEKKFRKKDTDYALIMLDADKFKDINDLYGHSLGDFVLKNFAASISQSIRSVDYAFRFGGDEFVLILPEASKQTVDEIFSQIEANLQGIKGISFPINVSYGCALRSEGTTIKEIMALADKRMYEYKRNKAASEA